MSDEMKQILIKVPNSLKAWLHSRAKENHRTLTGEIAFRLERSRTQDEAREEEAA